MSASSTTERLQNLSTLIRENLYYLIRRMSLAIVTLVLIFSIIIVGLYVYNGTRFHGSWLLGLFGGVIVSLITINVSYPLGFRFTYKKELTILEQPEKLFNLYFGSGLLMALFMVAFPVAGLLTTIFCFGSSASHHASTEHGRTF